MIKLLPFGPGAWIFISTYLLSLLLVGWIGYRARRENTLNDFYYIQGGCERINNTVFPRIYSFLTTLFTWLFAFSLIFSLYDDFNWEILVMRVVVAYVFLTLEKISRSLKDPFVNGISDTPMTAICRTIEIDLREMLGEKDVPLPVMPIKGVLY